MYSGWIGDTIESMRARDNPVMRFVLSVLVFSTMAWHAGAQTLVLDDFESDTSPPVGRVT